MLDLKVLVLYHKYLHPKLQSIVLIGGLAPRLLPELRLVSGFPGDYFPLLFEMTVKTSPGLVRNTVRIS